MKILDVELMKDPTGEMGWCYVVKTAHANAPTVHSATYVVLKPIIDRHKSKLFRGKDVDLTKNGRWEKLFNFTADAGEPSKRSHLNNISTFIIDYSGQQYGNIFMPAKVKQRSEYSLFRILNKKGLKL